jgi:HEAT repeat protein
MSDLHAAGESSLSELVGRLAHVDRLERVHAAAELVREGRQGGAKEGEVVRTVVEALCGERPIVRKMAALVLGDLAAEPARAVPALAAALGDRDEGVRRRAAVALGQFRTQAKAALAALRAALMDSDDGVRSFASTSLALIDPPGADPEEAA